MIQPPPFFFNLWGLGNLDGFDFLIYGSSPLVWYCSSVSLQTTFFSTSVHLYILPRLILHSAIVRVSTNDIFIAISYAMAQQTILLWWFVSILLAVGFRLRMMIACQRCWITIILDPKVETLGYPHCIPMACSPLISSPFSQSLISFHFKFSILSFQIPF